MNGKLSQKSESMEKRYTFDYLGEVQEWDLIWSSDKRAIIMRGEHVKNVLHTEIYVTRSEAAMRAVAMLMERQAQITERVSKLMSELHPKKDNTNG